MDADGAARQAPPPEEAAARPAPPAPPGAWADAAWAAPAPRPRTRDVTDLSPEDADRVIRRALELHDADRQLAAARMSARDLEDVVAELGIPSVYVRRALEEVLVTGPRHVPSQVERLLAPRVVGAARVVPAGHDATRAAVARWLSDDEGLVLRGRGHDGERWSRDRRVQAAVRHGLKLGRGTGYLRRMGGVTVRVAPLAEDQQLVEMEADTSSAVATGLGVGAAGVAAGAVVGGISAAVLGDGWPDLAQAAAGFVPVAGLGLLAARGAARSVAAQARKAVTAALDGIALLATGGDTGPQREEPGDWRAMLKGLLGRPPR